MTSTDNLQIINEKKRNMERGDTILLLIPETPGQEHISLLLSKVRGVLFFRIDSQGELSLSSKDTVNLLQRVNIQTNYKGGSCGYWVMQLCTEILTHHDIYQNLITEEDKCNFRILEILILNTCINISKRMENI